MVQEFLSHVLCSANIGASNNPVKMRFYCITNPGNDIRVHPSSNVQDNWTRLHVKLQRVEASGKKKGRNGTTSTATPMTIKLNVSKMRLILVKDIIHTFVSCQKLTALAEPLIQHGCNELICARFEC
jgi:hypothetical protein